MLKMNSFYKASIPQHTLRTAVIDRNRPTNARKMKKVGRFLEISPLVENR